MQVKKDKEDGFIFLFGKAITVVIGAITFLSSLVGIIYHYFNLGIIESLAAVAVFVILLATGVWVYATNKNFSRIDEKIDTMDEKIDTVDKKIDSIKNSIDEKIDTMDEKIDTVDKKIDTVDGKIGSMEKAFEEILKVFGIRYEKGVYMKNSPLALNETGEKISKDMGADDIIEAHKDSLIEMFNIQGLKNAYDVQVACIHMTNKTWVEVLEPETLDKMKKVAYDNGLELEHCYKVLGLMLRDAILSTREESADVDKHSPDDSTD